MAEHTAHIFAGVRPLIHAPRLAALLRPIPPLEHLHRDRHLQASRPLDDAHVHAKTLLHCRNPRKLAPRRLAAVPALTLPAQHPRLRRHRRY